MVKVARLIEVIMVATILAISSLVVNNIGIAEAAHGGMHIGGSGTSSEPIRCPTPQTGSFGSLFINVQGNGQLQGFVEAHFILTGGDRITKATTDGNTFDIAGSARASCGQGDPNGDYIFTYQASGGCGDGVTASVSVSNGASGRYRANINCVAPPTADAGTGQTVNEGDSVTLDGSASSDTDGTIASYSWTQTAGTSVTLSGANTATPEFTAPDVGPEGATLTFELTVTDDDGATSTTPDSVDITVDDVVANSPPTAELTANPSTINEGETSALDASGSSDPDSGDSLTYSFTILDNGPGTITDQTDESDPTATYEAPSDVSSDQRVKIQVEVSDGNSDPVTATAEILVTDTTPPPLNEVFPDQGSCITEANNNPDAGFTKDDCKAAFKDNKKQTQPTPAIVEESSVEEETTTSTPEEAGEDEQQSTLAAEEEGEAGGEEESNNTG